jgi:hypothetical protein
MYHVLKNSPKDEHITRFKGDISSATGVREMMDERFDKIVPSELGQGLWTDRTHASIKGGPTPIRVWLDRKGHHNLKRSEPSTKPPEMRQPSKKVKEEKPSRGQGGGGGAAESKEGGQGNGYGRAVCPTFLLHMLKATYQSKKVEACPRGKACHQWHPDHLGNHKKAALHKFVHAHEKDLGKMLDAAFEAVQKMA